MCNTQRKLDLFSGINLIRNLKKLSIINVDKYLKNIILSSNSQLASQFNHLYKESK